MAIATAPRGRTSAALSTLHRIVTGIAAIFTVSIEIYRDAMARRDAFYARNPHLSED